MRLPSNRFARDCSALHHHNAVMRSRRCVEEANGVVLSRRTHVEDVEHRQPNLTARSVAEN
jgi:hypothetical protein